MRQRVNKSDQAYDAVEAMITFQELAPGSMISEPILMHLTGFGRTPIREALQRLARERMVEIHPNRGVFVASASLEEQLKLLELRRVVEELAVRLAAQRANAQQAEAMQQLAEEFEQFSGDDVKDFAGLLKRAHQVVALAAYNHYLEVAMAPLQGLSRRFWFAHLRNPGEDLRAAADLHGAILRATCDGNEDDAAAASLALNNYLTQFAHDTIRPPRARSPQVAPYRVTDHHKPRPAARRTELSRGISLGSAK
ncbi:GntR family transcriptional regulator [Micromonospora fulviviridis]|uniref:GntR family transcriptional regulator n=1 Tax=Micromonospora fulviviridis TaxID=47860 RepID=A0ABV2VXH3_9ACTN